MNRRYFLKMKGAFFSNLLLLGSGGALYSLANTKTIFENPSLPVIFQFSIRYNLAGVQSDQFQKADSIEQINESFTKQGLILRRDKKESVDSQDIYHAVWTYEFRSVQAAHSWEKAIQERAHIIWPRSGEQVADFGTSIRRSYPTPFPETAG